MSFRQRLKGSLSHDLSWAERRGLLDDPVNRSLGRALALGVEDAVLEEAMSDRVDARRMQEALGQVPPFREPQLRDGELLLGASSLGNDVRMPLQALSRGTLIAMQTGGGKTNVLRFLALQIAQAGVRVWLTDQWKREQRHLLPLLRRAGQELVVLRPLDMMYDPLHPGGCDPRHHLAKVSRILGHRLGLAERSETILYEICWLLYDEYGILEGRNETYPCLFDVWEKIRSTPGLNQAAKEAILDRLGAVLVELQPCRLSWNPSDLAGFNIVFEMSGVSENLKHILVESLLHTVFQKEVEKGLVNAPLGLFVALDDAQAYAQPDLGGEATPLDLGAGLFRSTGLGVCVSVQTLRGLSKKLVPNLGGLKLMGPMGCHDDYFWLGSDMGLDQEQIDWAKRNLSPGAYIARVDSWPDPFVLQVPRVDAEASVSDQEVSESEKLLSSLKTVPATEYADWKPHHIIKIRSQTNSSNPSQAASSGNGKPTQKPLDKDELDYLEAVALSPFVKATQRDQELGLSSSKGHRVRKALLRRGFVKSVSVNPGGRGRAFQLLELTKKGRSLLHAYGVKIPRGRGRGGAEHQYWAYTIASWLGAREQTTAIEDESGDTRVDVVVMGSRGDIAIEIEVSPGHELENIEKDIEAGFSRVVCLVKEAGRVEEIRAECTRRLRSGWEHLVCIGELQHYAEILDNLPSQPRDERRNESKKEEG